MTALLRGKGAEVLGGFLARGQVHHPAPHMMGQFRGHPDEEDLNRARHFAIDMFEHVSDDPQGPLPGSRPDALKRGLGFYDTLGSTLTDRRLRRMMPEPEPDPSKCDQCNWCVEECPMDNITLKSYPIFGERCIRCYHCLNGCPQGAFKVNWRYSDPLLRILYHPTFMGWFGDLRPGEQVY
jgi:ferredoxin